MCVKEMEAGKAQRSCDILSRASPSALGPPLTPCCEPQRGGLRAGRGGAQAQRAAGRLGSAAWPPTLPLHPSAATPQPHRPAMTGTLIHRNSRWSLPTNPPRTSGPPVVWARCLPAGLCTATRWGSARSRSSCGQGGRGRGEGTWEAGGGGGGVDEGTGGSRTRTDMQRSMQGQLRM